MKGPDETIERVLSGLRDVEAPDGLEQRVLRAIAEGVEHRATRRWNWRSSLHWRAAGGFAVAMLTIAILHRPTPAHEPNVPGAHPRRSTVVHSAGAAVTTTSSSKGLLRPARMRRRSAVFADSSPAPMLIASSSPVSTMPLTEQEKLLLQVARRGEPSPAPTLDPDQLALREAEAEAAFKRSLAKLPDAAPADVEPHLPEVNPKGESQ